MSLKSQIEQAASNLGFSAFGVTDSNYDPIGHAKLQDWLGRGYQAEMSYLERGPRQRFDPRVHLRDAQSVIAVAMNYFTEPQADPKRGYISIYARGRNYHFVLREKLNLLCEKINQLSGQECKFKIYVDSGAIAEKPLALKAGLGFIGRNATLIIPKNRKNTRPLGSYHFLGIIITDLKLEPDSPGTGTCGQCRKCIDACPTDAIVDDGVIDAGKCISYQTTQNKGEIPDNIGAAMGNMVFGCDICQIVCPYNSRAEVTTEVQFIPDPELINLNLQLLQTLSDDDFSRRFSESSIGEFSKSMFTRNVKNALNNISTNSQ